MPGTDIYGQNVPYPKLSDKPNAEAALSALVGGVVSLSNMTFANANARAAALSSPVAGMETYLVAEKRKDIWNGTSWQQVSSVATYGPYTPIWDGLSSLGSATKSGRFITSGNRVRAVMDLTAGASASLGTEKITVTLPVPAANVGDANFGWQGVGRYSANDGTAWKQLIAFVAPASTTATVFAVRGSDNGWVNPGVIGAAWVPGSYMSVEVDYEI